jgi:hypothetical protein
MSWRRVGVGAAADGGGRNWEVSRIAVLASGAGGGGARMWVEIEVLAVLHARHFLLHHRDGCRAEGASWRGSRSRRRGGGRSAGTGGRTRARAHRGWPARPCGTRTTSTAIAGQGYDGHSRSFIRLALAFDEVHC